MSIIFMGTPEWAIPSLKAVIECGIEVRAVFTQPDRRVKRKRELAPSPVKQFALEQNLAVYSPENAGSEDTMNLVRSMSPKMILVCAYGQILTQQFLDIPHIGCFNLHFSYMGNCIVKKVLVKSHSSKAQKVWREFFYAIN